MEGTFPQLEMRRPSEFGYIMMPFDIQVDTMKVVVTYSFAFR